MPTPKFFVSPADDATRMERSANNATDGEHVPVFLGEYLVQFGFVTKEQLEAAVVIQTATNMRLGACAVALGHLSEADVIQIHEAQRQTDLPFGRLAVKLGKLTRVQLEASLEYQRFRHLRIGDALVKSGAIAAPLLLQALQAFSDIAPSSKRQSPTDAIAIAQNELVECSARLLLRIGNLRTKPSPWEPMDSGPDPKLYTTGIELIGATKMGLWISMAPQTATVLARGLLPGFDDPHLVGHDALDELVNMICGHTVAALETRGQQWKNSPPRRAWPELRSGNGGIVLLFVLDHPAIELRVVR
jgi:hypothetical protein